mgnify:FL=1
MKLGYPCMNYTIGCKISTFKLQSFSEERLVDSITTNLNNLEKILLYNKKNGFGFFRVSSDLIPFASHSIMNFDWSERFKDHFEIIGNIITENNFRISFHPGQFVLINSPKIDIFEATVRELEYHVKMLDLMNLDTTAKIQIHVGGVYGDMEAAKSRFIDRYHSLNQKIKNHLVIENDEKSFSLQDCLDIHSETSIPIIFDNLHHEVKNNGETLTEAMQLVQPTWTIKDGVPMVDYSSQQENSVAGKHCDTIDLTHFEGYLSDIINQFDVDIMFEIKDKELSALQALKLI